MLHSNGMRRTNSAFTLVEMSIVLVIIGLLVGGIVAGQSLIRASALKNVVTQYQHFVEAKRAFYDQYNAIPGDMANATNYWGVANAAPGICVTTPSTGTETCNGNGDGLVIAVPGSNEYYRYWQHLANAGMIEGRFDGITHGTTPYSSTSANSPSGRAGPGGLWFVINVGSPSGDTSYFDGTYGNLYEYGGAAANNDPTSPVFLPAEAWDIDVKLDDGVPGIGKVVARDVNGFTGTNCTSATASNQQATATYYMAGKTKQCVLVFPKQF